MKQQFEASCASLEVAEQLLDRLCSNGGQYLYEKYLHVKDKPHCAKRIISLFSESVQVTLTVA